MYKPIRYTQKNDHKPGYIYLMEAVGYHGILPGCYLRRCKIGLSKNPQLRLQNFHENQPPCDIKLLKTVYVEDMADLETKLHQRFKRRNVKLLKSKEWFDLYPIDFWLLNIELHNYQKSKKLNFYPFGILIVVILALISLSNFTKPRQTPTIKPRQQNTTMIK
ncbi:GIY-YIG nuclease family protein [Anabaena cylindrica UHCC 0172]|uniref:GIY-YIG nuclease family protein n=1 Tax=Anabaena cylindrica TaxID=1165 RepID=UPI002B21267A|nr:GIY-YIG nuclease family protein [Anabaena cylindrica]MEA5554393.1 GIY-YIG nuclease family protein [Anabaena cylindrica UHCC 0172]